MVNRDVDLAAKRENVDLAAMRENYELGALDIESVTADPLHQWKIWLDEAVAAEVLEPNAAVVSSIDEFGYPQSRILLIKGADDRGLIFYTNYSSAKANQFQRCSKAGLLFSWLDLQRQVRMTGTVEKVAPEISDHYFATRPRESQLGAWASPQSSVISGRDVLENAAAQALQRFGSDAVTRPPHWGGYRFVASSVEFWQGRPSRLHDRILYTKTPEQTDQTEANISNTGWSLQRLAP